MSPDEEQRARKSFSNRRPSVREERLGPIEAPAHLAGLLAPGYTPVLYLPLRLNSRLDANLGHRLLDRVNARYRSCKAFGRLEHGSLRVASVAPDEALWKEISGQTEGTGRPSGLFQEAKTLHLQMG
jgi:hypothetical protein